MHARVHGVHSKSKQLYIERAERRQHVEILASRGWSARLEMLHTFQIDCAMQIWFGVCLCVQRWSPTIVS